MFYSELTALDFFMDNSLQLRENSACQNSVQELYKFSTVLLMYKILIVCFPKKILWL